MSEIWKIAKRPHQVLNDAQYIKSNGLAEFAVSVLPELYGMRAITWFEWYRDMVVVCPDKLLITFAVDMRKGSLCKVCNKYSFITVGAKCNSNDQIRRETDRLGQLGFTAMLPGESIGQARSRGDVAGIDYVSARILFARLNIDL